MSTVRLVAYTKPAEFENLSEFIAYVARVSNPANQYNTETSEKLIKYLINNHHWSPFEMASVVMEIKTSRDIARQILRHRSFSFQEFSQRYAAVTDDPIFRQARIQDLKNRQNSIEIKNLALEEEWRSMQMKVWALANICYEWALNKGIAKEVARVLLPEGLTPSTMYMAGTVRSWIHYVDLRASNGTQKEHREIAEQCKEILKEIIPNVL